MSHNKILLVALLAVSAVSLGAALSGHFSTLPGKPDLTPASPETIEANSPPAQR